MSKYEVIVNIKANFEYSNFYKPYFKIIGYFRHFDVRRTLAPTPSPQTLRVKSLSDTLTDFKSDHVFKSIHKLLYYIEVNTIQCCDK